MKLASDEPCRSSCKVVLHLVRHRIMPLCQIRHVLKFSRHSIAKCRTIHMFVCNCRTEESEEHDVADVHVVPSEVISVCLIQSTLENLEPGAEFVCYFLNMLLSDLISGHEVFSCDRGLEDICQCVNCPVSGIALCWVHGVVAVLLPEESHDGSRLIDLPSFVFPERHLTTWERATLSELGEFFVRDPLVFELNSGVVQEHPNGFTSTVEIKVIKRWHVCQFL